MNRKLLVLIVTLLVFFTGCQKSNPGSLVSDGIVQVSLLNGLMLGDYDGTVSVGELLKLGDTGIGTFHRLDGEMIMSEGKVYKAKADGSVEVQAGGEMVPFCAVTFFDNDISSPPLAKLLGIEEIKKKLDAVISETSGDLNRFYVAKIEGTFEKVHVRSVPAQTKPYKPLSEIAKSQPEFHYENLEGTIVAYRCPDYVEGINVPGWHLHFISKDKTKGGHMLDANISAGTLGMDKVSDFRLMLPETKAFAGLKLSKNLSSETKKVESR